MPVFLLMDIFIVLVYNVTPKMLVSPACMYGLTNMYSSFLIVGFLKLSHDPLMGPGQHLKKEGETENVSIHIIICMQFYIYFIVCVCVCVCEYVYSFSGL